MDCSANRKSSLLPGKPTAGGEFPGYESNHVPPALPLRMAPFVIDEIQLGELPNQPCTGVKPVGRCCFAFLFLIVAKPGFHRREVGCGAGRCTRSPLASREWFTGLETTFGSRVPQPMQ